jgi:hypothetical protein
VAGQEHHGCLRRFAAYDLGVSLSVAVYWPPNEDMGDAIDEVERCLFTSPVASDGEMYQLWNMPSIQLGLRCWLASTRRDWKPTARSCMP